MPRPRLPIGTFGEITTRRIAQGRVEARTRYRDWDGKTRIVQATADTERAAERASKVQLSERWLFQPPEQTLELVGDAVSSSMALSRSARISARRSGSCGAVYPGASRYWPTVSTHACHHFSVAHFPR